MVSQTPHVPYFPFRESHRPMTGMGLVSRVTPVHTAMRNCTRDEGRSFEVGNQMLISNHRKLLWSKAMVGRARGFSGRRQPSCDGTSRMMREYQVRFCEGLGVEFPGSTRHRQSFTHCNTVESCMALKHAGRLPIL